MSKPRKLPRSTITRTAREIAGHMAVLESQADQIVAANDFIDDCSKGVAYDSVKRGGGDGSSVETAALAGQKEHGPPTQFGLMDDIGAEAAEFMALLDSSLKNARKLRSLAVTLGINWTEDAKSAASFVAKKENGEGDCVNCGRYVAGERDDRLRHDRCEACARYWSRHNRDKERPRHLFGSDSIDDTCQRVHTRAGIDRKCALEYDHAGPCSFAMTGSVQNGAA